MVETVQIGRLCPALKCYEIFENVPISGVFAIFDCNFAKTVAPTGDENANSIMTLKEQSVPKK